MKIVAGGMTQTEEIHSGGSYLSQNDLRVHFGLGSATKIDSVEIHWPSGATETLKDLAPTSSIRCWKEKPWYRSRRFGLKRSGNKPVNECR